MTPDDRSEEILRLQDQIDASHSGEAPVGISRVGALVYLGATLWFGVMIGPPETGLEFWLFLILLVTSLIFLMFVLFDYRETAAQRKALEAELNRLLRATARDDEPDSRVP